MHIGGHNKDYGYSRSGEMRKTTKYRERFGRAVYQRSEVWRSVCSSVHESQQDARTDKENTGE